MPLKKKSEALEILMLPYVNEMLNKHTPVTYRDICLSYEQDNGIEVPKYLSLVDHPAYNPARNIIATIKRVFAETNNSHYYLDYANKKDTRGGFCYPKHLTDPVPVMDLISSNRQQSYDQAQKQVKQMEDLFKNSSIICFDHPTQVHREELMPKIYDLIEKRRVFQIQYNWAFEKTTTVIIHPHFLKQYNRRWFLFGDAEFKDGVWSGISNIALDRIVGSLMELPDVSYKAAPKDYYQNYLSNIIGVSHEPECKDRLLRVRVRTLNKYAHGRILTKKLHKSQVELEMFDPVQQQGLFEIIVEPNRELLATLLSFGSQIRIEGEYLPIFKKEIEKLKDLY